MPIIDIEIVETAQVDAQALADALGKAFGAAPGKVWVRIRNLPASQYAENDAPTPHPVFVTVTASAPPVGAELHERIGQIVDAVARITRRPRENVHVEFQPAARGRIAFGGRLVE
jgi:phenylpyruvate tautomerase PptA (4-oxalocrotonate tautomerase family)